MIFCCFGILQKIWQLIRQCCVPHFTFSGLTLLNYNLFAVSVGEDGGFGFTKERFNILKEQQKLG